MNIMEDLERKWKPIDGYEGLYDLRDDGLIYSYKRKRYNYGSINTHGYLEHNLRKDGRKQIEAQILVYKTFVGPIPEGYDVHHINHNRLDNRVENLELMISSEHHSLHGKETFSKHKEKLIKSAIDKTSKAILQYTLDGKFVAEYQSMAEAERQTNIKKENICKCCKGERQSAGGYKWKYK